MPIHHLHSLVITTLLTLFLLGSSFPSTSIISPSLPAISPLSLTHHCRHFLGVKSCRPSDCSTVPPHRHIGNPLCCANLISRNLQIITLPRIQRPQRATSSYSATPNLYDHVYERKSRHLAGADIDFLLRFSETFSHPLLLSLQ